MHRSRNSGSSPDRVESVESTIISDLSCENTDLFRRCGLNDERLPFNVSPFVETDILPVQMMMSYCLSRTKAHYHSSVLSQA
jgi:hypothetical protein